MKHGRYWFAILLVLGVCHGSSGANVRAADEQVKPVTPNERVARLIEQLGAAEYNTRERAQAELANLGLEAFEALFEAQNHRDLEIATRAKYLIRGMNVRWYQESDPPEVKRLLKDYGDVSTEQRKGLIDKLLTIPGPGVLPVICRLVRYESDLVLSKYLAIKVIEQEVPASEEERRQRAHVIRDATTAGQRAATAWLRNYALTLEDPRASVPKWNELILEEEDVLARLPDQSSPAIRRDLLRFQVSLLSKLQLDKEADAAIDQVVRLSGQTKEEITELVGWLVTRKAWEKLIEVYTRNEPLFKQNPSLLYRLAQAQRELGKTDDSQQTAETALRLHRDNVIEHLVTADALKDAGLFEWAEREFRMVSEEEKPGSRADIQARFMLSEMLHDQANELEAAKTLQGVVDIVEKDADAASEAASIRGDLSVIYSRMHYFYAQHYAEQKDWKKHEEQLELAVAKEPTDADVLIALYRLPNASEERMKKTKELITESADMFRQEAQEYRTRLERAGSEAEEEAYSTVLAQSYNQYAWLVGNTTGDYQEALQFSLRSLELRPGEAGHLDTLARCYFALGDLDNAIKNQQEACRIDPYSGQLARQLKFFLKEQKNRTGAEQKAS